MKFNQNINSLQYITDLELDQIFCELHSKLKRTFCLFTFEIGLAGLCALHLNKEV